MFCPKCGNKNADGVIRCFSCDAEMPSSAAQSQLSRFIYDSEDGGGQHHSLRPHQSNEADSGPVQPPRPPYIPTYLVYAILVTVLCCSPLGIPAIVFACEVDSNIARGDIAAAQRFSKRAKAFSIAALAISVGIVLFFIFFSAISTKFFLDSVTDFNRW